MDWSHQLGVRVWLLRGSGGGHAADVDDAGGPSARGRAPATAPAQRCVATTRASSSNTRSGSRIQGRCRSATASVMNRSPKWRFRRRASVTAGPPATAGAGRGPLPALAQRLAIQGRNRTPRVPEGSPGLMRTPGRSPFPQAAHTTNDWRPLAIGQIEMRPVPERRILRTWIRRLATPPRRLRQPPLDHRSRRAEEVRIKARFVLRILRCVRDSPRRSAVQHNFRRNTKGRSGDNDRACRTASRQPRRVSDLG